MALSLAAAVFWSCKENHPPPPVKVPPAAQPAPVPVVVQKSDPAPEPTGPQPDPDALRLTGAGAPFAWAGKALVYGDGDALVRREGGKPLVLGRTKGVITAVRTHGEQILVEEKLPRNPGYLSSDDPVRIWLWNGRTLSLLNLAGYGEQLEAVELPFSPDGKWIAVGSWKNKKPGPGAERGLVFFRPSTGEGFALHHRVTLELLGWKGDLARLRTADWQQPDWHEWFTVSMTRRRFEPAAALSHPDSPHGTFELKAGAIRVTPHQKAAFEVPLPLSDVRRLSDVDARWVSERYVAVRASRHLLVDVETRQVSFFGDKGLREAAFNSDMSEVAYVTDGGLFLTRVTAR